MGIAVNSVETIVFDNAAASNEAYIHQKIQQAEAIWFAGGDQWRYVSYWRNNTIGQLINEAIQDGNIVIGGTSAGMAILGGIYFSAENGTITSAQALSNPYDPKMAVDSAFFLSVPYLQHTLTDTHYDNPNRKGRHIAFLARMIQDFGIATRGIAFYRLAQQPAVGLGNGSNKTSFCFVIRLWSQLIAWGFVRLHRKKEDFP